jgi:hypothetical protein
MAYAEDVTVFAFGKTVDDVRLQLQSLLDLAATWAEVNCILFGPVKCNVVLITATCRTAAGQLLLSDLTLNSQTLSTVDHLTILDIDISSNLSWVHHAQK